jgi:hypothetical protein
MLCPSTGSGRTALPTQNQQLTCGAHRELATKNQKRCASRAQRPCASRARKMRLRRLRAPSGLNPELGSGPQEQAKADAAAAVAHVEVALKAMIVRAKSSSIATPQSPFAVCVLPTIWRNHRRRQSPRSIVFSLIWHSSAMFFCREDADRLSRNAARKLLILLEQNRSP